MIGRRNHKKSRNGCTECKRRKVKCDERKPACFNCERYGAICSLSSAESASSSRHDARHEAAGKGKPAHRVGGMPILSLPQSPADTPSACSPFTNDAGGAVVPDRTAELMHHWCTVTADTVATSEDQRVAWKVLIPRQGYEHQFVMDALLCVAALHRAYLSPILRATYLDVSARYQVLASEAFRAFLPGVTAENMRWKPVLCFARIIGLYIMCMPFRSMGGRLMSPIFNTTELIASLKAIVSFVRPYRHLGAGIEYGAYHGVYEAARQETSNCVVPPDTRHTLVPEDTFAAIAELRVFIADEFKDDYDRSRLMAYSKSVDSLETAARLAVRTGLQAEPAFILYWSSLVEEAVVADIRAYQHPALILLAHFFVLFAMLERQFWFTRGWAKDVVGDVDVRVRGHPRMARMMKWPMQRVWEHAL